MPRRGAYLTEKTLRISRDASGKNQRNIKQDMQLTGLIVDLQFILTGTMTSTAGGAVAAFEREAPWSIVTLLELAGNFRRGGRKRQILSADPTIIYWPASLLAGQPGELLKASSGASATDALRGVLPNLIKDVGSLYAPFQYIDTRLYTSLDLLVQWGADSLLAGTNLASIDSEEILVTVKELVGALPPPKAPHFEPAWVTKRHLTEGSNTKVDNDPEFSFDGIASHYFFEQIDVSAAGDLERVNTLVKRLTMNQASSPIVDNADWSMLRRKTQEHFPLGNTTSYPNGIVGLPAEPPLDSRDGAVSVIRDTLTGADAGETGVTPATGDAFHTTLFVSEPNPAMARLMGV